MMLPLCHGGLELHMQSDEVSDTAFMAGADQRRCDPRRCVHGRHQSRAQPEGAPSCALPSARGWWRLRAGAVAQPSRTVRGAVQMGRSSEGLADGVPGQQERAAWGAAASEEEEG